MDAGTTSAHRNRKRPLDGRPCNPKVKRRLFPADVPCPSRRAAEMDRSLLLKRRRRVIAEASGLVEAAADELCLLSEMGSYSRRELGPFYVSLGILLSAMRARDEAAEAPVEVRPDPYEDDSMSTSSTSPPAVVENNRGRGAASVAVTHGDDAVRSKRRAKANSKYFGPQWTKK